MKIIKYNNSDDIDVEFLDKFHYVKNIKTMLTLLEDKLKILMTELFME